MHKTNEEVWLTDEHRHRVISMLNSPGHLDALAEILLQQYGERLSPSALLFVLERILKPGCSYSYRQTDWLITLYEMFAGLR
jgi:hypothetical protein